MRGPIKEMGPNHNLDGQDWLKMGPKFYYRSAEIVGDPNWTLSDSIGPSNQAHPGPIKTDSPQT